MTARTFYKVAFYLQTWQHLAMFQFWKVHVCRLSSIGI